MSSLRRALARVPDALPLLALLAAALAVFAPLDGAAGAVDSLLAALVLVTALDIDPRRLRAIRDRGLLVTALAVAPLAVLGTIGWGLSALAGGSTGTGVLAVSLAPTEVAAVGLVGLMAGPAELAVAVLAASLAVSAVLAPPLLGVLAPVAHPVDIAALLGRFALVVLAPLGVGLAVRIGRPASEPPADALAVAASLLVVALVYASLSGTRGGGLASAAAVGCAFLLVSGALAAAAVGLSRGRLPASLGLTVAMRDFAVAAALATAAGGAAAARVAGVYGVLMLIAGAGATGAFRARARRPRGSAAGEG